MVLIQYVHYHEHVSQTNAVDHYGFVMGFFDASGMLYLIDQCSSGRLLAFQYFQGHPLSSLLRVIMLLLIVLF